MMRCAILPAALLLLSLPAIGARPRPRAHLPPSRTSRADEEDGGWCPPTNTWPFFRERGWEVERTPHTTLASTLPIPQRVGRVGRVHGRFPPTCRSHRLSLSGKAATNEGGTGDGSQLGKWVAGRLVSVAAPGDQHQACRTVVSQHVTTDLRRAPPSVKEDGRSNVRHTRLSHPPSPYPNALDALAVCTADSLRHVDHIDYRCLGRLRRTKAARVTAVSWASGSPAVLCRWRRREISTGRAARSCRNT